MAILVAFTTGTTATREPNIFRLAHPHEIHHWKKGIIDPTSAARFAPPIVMLYDRLILQNVDGTLHPTLAEALTPPLKHKSWVAGVFSPDGELVLTWGSDGTAQVWGNDTREKLTLPMKHICCD